MGLQDTVALIETSSTRWLVDLLDVRRHWLLKPLRCRIWTWHAWAWDVLRALMGATHHLHLVRMRRVSVVDFEVINCHWRLRRHELQGTSVQRGWTRWWPISLLPTAWPLEVLVLPDILSEDLEVLLHVVSDHPLTFRSEDREGVRQLRDVELHRGMIVEEPNIISSSHKEPVVLSKAYISEDTAVLN